MDKFLLLFKRDFFNCINKRLFLLLGFMVLFQTWFIVGSGSVAKVIESGQLNYMAIVFSFNFFGPLVALALTFDSISSERQNKVMDMLLTSGLTKRTVILSKTAMNLAISFVFSTLYVALIAVIYLLMSGNGSVALKCLAYIPALTAFSFLYCMLGLVLSILFRSSKVSFITSMIIGLLCMPRLLVSVFEGIGNALGLGAKFVELASMTSPALIMNALGGADGNILAGLCFLAFYITLMISLSMVLFSKQDELNYGE